MKVYFKTVGCRVNQVETQSLAEKFLSLGYEQAAEPEEADVVVVNSCSVTEYADRDAVKFLKKIRVFLQKTPSAFFFIPASFYILFSASTPSRGDYIRQALGIFRAGY